MSSLTKRIESIEDSLNLQRKPISEWAPGMDEAYLGCPLDTPVSVREYLTLQHNAVLHQYHILRPNDASWKDDIKPVPGIPQSWGNVELAKEDSHV